MTRMFWALVLVALIALALGVRAIVQANDADAGLAARPWASPRAAEDRVAKVGGEAQSLADD